MVHKIWVAQQQLNNRSCAAIIAFINIKAIIIILAYYPFTFNN